MPYGIVLLPPPDVARRLIGYSAAIGGLADARMTLGDAAPPHVTVLHAACDLPAARDWWERVRDHLGDAGPVTTGGLAFAPVPAGDFYLPEGGVYFGLEIVRHKALAVAHEAALRAARDVGAEPLGRVGEGFRPHITLGVGRRFPVGEVELPADLVTTSFPVTPALGELGPYGTFPRLLA
jgi:hypothetical protein